MFSSRTRRFASPMETSVTSSSSSSSDGLSIPARRRSPSYSLGQLDVEELDQMNSAYSAQRQREPFRIPRPIIGTPQPSIDVPMWIPDRRMVNERQRSLFSNPFARMRVVEQPVYQIAPPLVPIPIQYPISPIATDRSAPQNFFYRLKRKKFLQEKATGLCATFCSGGCGTLVVLVYLICLLALPACKLVLGVVYRNQCPVNKNIPLYMIVAGGSGVAMILFLLLSSGCTYCRGSIKARKSVHSFMVCTIGFARGMQGVGALFLFVWFIFGNIWVFGERYRVRTDSDALSIATEKDNYCHPALYWFAFYVLIFTYILALLGCMVKFCFAFLCCRACDVYKGAFS